MRIYNKSAFLFGILCVGGLFLFALDIISVDWWQWVLAIAISCRYLYVGLSKTANKQAAAIRQSYKETAIMLYGKYALVKTNLPIILTVSFFGIALFIRVAFDFITSVGVVTIFCILLTISVVYSISLDRTIQNTIRDEIDTVQ